MNSYILYIHKLLKAMVNYMKSDKFRGFDEFSHKKVSENIFEVSIKTSRFMGLIKENFMCTCEYREKTQSGFDMGGVRYSEEFTASKKYWTYDISDGGGFLRYWWHVKLFDYLELIKPSIDNISLTKGELQGI